MSEKYDDDELDFDDDFGDFDLDPFSEPPIPKGRSPITHSLLKTGKKFTESFTDDKMDTARKYADASIPSAISGEAYDIKRIVSGAQEGYRTAVNEVRNEAKPFLDAVDKVIPKGGKTQALVNLAREKMGLNDTNKNNEQIAEDSANKAVMAVSEIFGEQRTKEEYVNLVRDNIRTKRELSGLEIAATTASNLEFINRFNQEIVSKYQRKSLELQYRHLYTADEQLAVTKTAFDGFKNQLESIVINSALPELVKMKSSEFVEAKLYDKLTEGLFSNEGTIGAIRNKFLEEIKGIGSTIAGGMNAATSGLEQYDNFKEISKMAGGTEGLVAQLAADGLINVIGNKTGNMLSKTIAGKKIVDYVRKVMLDPSEQFKEDAEGRKDGFMKSFFKTASDFTNVGVGEKTYSLSNGDGRDVAIFDNKTQTSITKIIPGLLTKILASVDSIRTKKEPEELRYDFDTGTFETITETRSKIKSSIEKDLDKSGVKRNIKYVVEDIDKTLPENLKFKEGEKENYREGILRYVYSGKSLHPDYLEKNGFYKFFDEKSGLKLKIAINRYIKKDGGANKRRFKDYLERLRTSAPDPMKTLRKYNDSGSMDLLRETGLVMYDEDSKSYRMNNEEYKNTLAKAIRVDDLEEEEIKKKEFKSKIVEGLYNRSKEAYEKREKDKAENPKKETNVGKGFKYIGDKAIELTNYLTEESGKDITSVINNIKDSFKDVNDVDSFKKALNSLKIVKSGIERAESIKKVRSVIISKIKEAKDPKEFFRLIKETEEYQGIHASLKDELERIYGVAKKGVDAVVADVKDTETFNVVEKAMNKTKDFSGVVFNIVKTAVTPKVTELVNKLMSKIDDDTLSITTKHRLIQSVLKGLRKTNTKLQEASKKENIDDKELKEIIKLSKDTMRIFDKLIKYDVNSKSKLSILIKLSIRHLTTSSKYISSNTVINILKDINKAVDDNIESTINTVNDSFSRDNDNNVGIKIKGFVADVKETVENVKESIGIQPKLYGPVEPPKTDKITDNPIVSTNGLAAISPNSKNIKNNGTNVLDKIIKRINRQNRTTENIMGEITDHITGKNNLNPDYTELPDPTTQFNEKLLKKVKFNTTYYDKKITDDFKDLLRKLNVNDGTLSRLASFGAVMVCNDLPPNLAAAYYHTTLDSTLNKVLVINSNVINMNTPNIRYEIHNIIAHEYKHMLQSVKGDLKLNVNGAWYDNTIEWKGKLLRAAEYISPFKKYLSSGWEKEAYTEGYSSMYDQLVSENKIDPKKTNKKSWVGKLYGKVYGLLKKQVKESIPIYKKDFESKGIEWLYDSEGGLLKNKLSPLENNVNSSINSIGTASAIPKNKIDDNTDSNLVDELVKNTSKINPDVGIMNRAFNTVKEKTKSTFKTVKENISTSREDILNKVSDKSFDKLYKDIDAAETDNYKKIVITDFISRMNRLLSIVTKLTRKNNKNASLLSKIENIRSRLKDLAEVDIKDLGKLSKTIEDIKEDMTIIANKVVPEDEVLEKKTDEFNKKTVKEDNDTFLDILNSEDPVGALKAKVNSKIKSIIKKGIVGTYNFGKKIVKADLERGKKLRAYLKDKLLNGKPTLLRRGLNKGFNLTGSLISKLTGKTINTTKKAVTSDMENGDSLRDFVFGLFKGKKDKPSKNNKKTADTEIVKKPKRVVAKNNVVSKISKDEFGNTKGSWESILKRKEANKNKQDIAPKTITEKIKSPMGIATVIALGMAALASMGVTMKDVAAFAKGTWDVLKGVGTVLGGIWDTLKTVGGWIKDSFGWIKDKLGNIPGIGKFFKSDAGMTKEESEVARKKLAEMEASGKTGGSEYDLLKSKIDKYDRVMAEEATSGSSMLGTAAGVGVAAYVGKKIYNVGKGAYNVVKGGINAVKGVSTAVGLTKTADAVKNVASKVDSKDVTKKAVSSGKLVKMLETFKTYIAKKFKGTSGKAVMKLLASKIAKRLVPLAGAAVLAYDISKISYDVFVNGTELKSAISKQVLGFDLFSDDAIAIDENGNELKPDENTDNVNNTSLVKGNDEKLDKRIEQVDKNVGTTNEIPSPIRNIDNHNINNDDKKVQDTKTMSEKVSGFFGGVKDKLTDVKNNVIDKVSVSWDAVKGMVSKGIGAVAAYFESGGKGKGAGVISGGVGDPGGVSYGTHQLASKTGTLREYLKGSKYGHEFSGLTPATPAFDNKWKEIFARDPEGFAADQEAFIAKSHYLPQVKKLNTVGLDVNARSDALKSAVFSAGVQFGGRTGLITNALGYYNVDPKTTNDEAIIRAIYGYKKEKNDSLFKSSSPAVKRSVLQRATNEESVVLNLLAKEGHKDPVADAQTKVGTESVNDITYKPEVKTNVDAPASTVAPNTDTNIKTVVDTATPTATNSPVSTTTSPVTTNNVSSNLSNNISPTVEQPTTISTVDNSAITAITETNKGLATISSTLSNSLEVQKQMLEALNVLSKNLTDKSLNLSKEEMKETPVNKKEKYDDKNLTQTIGKPNIDLSRKKYA